MQKEERMTQNQAQDVPTRFAFYIRVTESEYARVKTMCDSTRCTAQDLFKKALLGRVNLEKPIYLFTPEATQEIKTDLSRIGNNVNQIAKKVNSGLMQGWSTALNGVYRALLDLNAKLEAKHANR